MEEHLNPLAVTHILQHTLRSLCIHENSQWVYAVFWRILPRNYPPPKWDHSQGGAYDRSRGNRRNWILVWEDGFCNFSASSAAHEINSGGGDCSSGSSLYGNCDYQHYQGLQPELFFKMSHEIYNYGEGLIGKVAADHSHKWIYNEPNDPEINFLSSWHNSADAHPRTWEAQFQSGIKTIALIAVREGVVQLGAVQKVVEDLSYVVLLRKKFSYIESIPGVLLPHPSSSPYPFTGTIPDTSWHYAPTGTINTTPPGTDHLIYDPYNQPLKITPSMSSLEALLSKLPSVVPPTTQSQFETSQFIPTPTPHPPMPSSHRSMEFLAKQETDNEEYCGRKQDVVEGGESSTSISAYDGRQQEYYRHHQQQQQHHRQHHNVSSSSSRPNNVFSGDI